jgi:hypothetical protein
MWTFKAMLLKNEKGLSLPAALIVIAGLGIASYSVLEIQNVSKKLTSAQNSLMGAEIARSKILAAIMNSENWKKTRERNPYAGHSETGSSPTTGRSGDALALVNPSRAITFYNSDNSIFYSPGGSPGTQTAAQGFGVDGEMFYIEERETLPNIYFKVIVNILERDPDANCINCADRVAGYVEVIQPEPANPTAALPVFTGSTAFDFTRTKTNRSLEQACELFGGEFNAVTLNCSYRLGFEVSCPTGTTFSGVLEGEARCDGPVSLQQSPCPTGEFAYKMVEGRFVCKPLPNAHGDDDMPILSVSAD